MAPKRLIGSDGKLQAGGFGTPLGSGDPLIDGTWYRITAIDGTASAWPDNGQVGLMYLADGTETLATDDAGEPWEGTDFCDVQNWSLEFSAAEVDVTTMCDDQNVYRAGKTDVTGSLEGIMTIEITDSEGGFQNKFVQIVKQDVSQTAPDDYIVQPIDATQLYVKLYTDKTTLTGEWLSFYFFPVTLTGFSASAGGEDAQTFSSPFRVAASDQGVTFYEYKNP